MKKLLSLTFILCFGLVLPEAHGWTLNNVTRSGFPVSDIKIKIGSDNCSNANLSASALDAIVKDAISEYWNSVATSSLELSSIGVSGISLTADDLNTAVNKAASNGIIIGCSQNAGLFTSAGILGIGGIGCANGVCRGVVLMNDTAGTNLALVDRATVITALAHEIGHAVGLGHSSVKGALMYFDLTDKTQKTLHQDDMDGISYLYPNKKKLSGLAGSCGTIDTTPGQRGNFIGSMLVGLILVAAMRFKNRRAY